MKPAIRDGGFANNLKYWRTQRDLTQEKLGELIGYDNKVISKWEKGITEPNLDALVNLSKALTITIDQLVTMNVNDECITKREFKVKDIELKGLFCARQVLLFIVEDLGLSIHGPIARYQRKAIMDLSNYYDLLEKLKN